MIASRHWVDVFPGFSFGGNWPPSLQGILYLSFKKFCALTEEELDSQGYQSPIF